MEKKKWLVRLTIGAEVLFLGLLLISLFLPQRLKGIERAVSQTILGKDGSTADETEKKDYIKWVDFTVPASVMQKAFRYDVDTCQEEIHLNWIDLLAYLGAKYGGDYSLYKAADMDQFANALKEGQTIESLTGNMKYFSYYKQAYTAVLGGMVGTYEIEIPASEAPAFALSDALIQEGNQAEGQDAPAPSEAESSPSPDTALPNQTVSAELTEDFEEAAVSAEQLLCDNQAAEGPDKVWVTKYGLKAFLPIAKNFPYNDFDDFGTARSYGFKRQHLGHDMMGQVGTPVIAVESGYVEAIGWNQYGGWRLGIRSFDKKRYYYYAHLRRNYPFHKSLVEGSVVTAGDVIGYMGRTGYSATENTNNIDTPHLHFGLQLIFDESQKEGNNEIWIDCYEIIKFLAMNKSETYKNQDTKEYNRIYQMKDPETAVQGS